MNIHSVDKKARKI